MRAVKWLGLALLVLLLGGERNAFRADDRESEEVIEHIMKKAFDGKHSLVKRAIEGDPSKEERKKLLDMMVALAKTRPEHGGMDSWKKKTSALVEAAQDLVNDKDDAAALLNEAANCKSCHKVHAGKERQEKDRKAQKGRDDD